MKNINFNDIRKYLNTQKSIYMKIKVALLNGLKTCSMVLSFFILLPSKSVEAQVKYNPAGDLREAEMGVERVARYYLPAYAAMANNNNEIHKPDVIL